MDVNALAKVLYEHQNRPAKWDTDANQYMKESWLEHATWVILQVEIQQEKRAATRLEDRLDLIERHLGLR
jgi:hypothetical protein